MQKFQFHHHGHARHVGSQFPRQLHASSSGSSRRQQVVHNQHALSGLDRIAVHLQRVGSIFQFIGDARRLRRQLARLADRGKSCSQPAGQRRGEDEAARFDAQYQIDLLA